MKLFYLTRYQYSRRLLQEILIVLEIAVLLMMAAPLMEHWAQMNAGFRLIRQLKEEAFFFQGPSKDGLPEEEWADWFNQIRIQVGADRVGCTAHTGASIDGTSTDIIFYNEALLFRLTIPMLKGVNHLVTQEGEIPVLISPAMSKEYHVGDKLTTQVFNPATQHEVSLAMCVVGVLRDTGGLFEFGDGASEGQADLSSLGCFSLGERYILALSGFDKLPSPLYSSSCLLFTRGMSEIDVQALLSSLAKLGVVTPLRDMKLLHRKRLFSSNVMIFVAPALMLLVAMMGVCIYVISCVIEGTRRFGVYYLCGMSWQQGLVVQIFSLQPLLFLGVVIAAAVELFLGEQVAALLRVPPASETTLLPIMMGIIALYLLGIVTAALRFRKLSPLTAIRKGE